MPDLVEPGRNPPGRGETNFARVCQLEMTKTACEYLREMQNLKSLLVTLPTCPRKVDVMRLSLELSISSF